MSLPSLTHVPSSKQQRLGIAAGANPIAEYARNFAKIIPTEAITAYAALGAVASSLQNKDSGVLFIAWVCLVAAIIIRLLTSRDPTKPDSKMQWLPAIGAGLAFALYVYSQGGDLGYRFGMPDADLKIWAGLWVGIWGAFAPVIIPHLVRK